MNTEKDKKNLGLRIKALRNSKNYSQEAFCELIGLEQANLSKIENGKTFPDITTLFNIIRQSAIEPNYILDFLSNSNKECHFIDYEISELLSKLSVESKIRLKKIIEAIVSIYE